MKTPSVVVDIDGRELKLSNLDKVLFARSGFTKGQVIDYYDRISPAMLPHLQARPLTLKRYPDGAGEEFFYEKQCPPHPEWIDTVCVPQQHRARRGTNVNFCVANSRAALLWVANLAALEMHVLLSRSEDLSRPTSMVFDLDPGAPAGLRECAQVALAARALLESIGLQSMIKTSGGKGLHLYVPLNAPATFDQTKEFAHAIAGLLEQRDPLIVTNMRKSLRAGKVFIDWGQNEDFKTTICAYSLRAVDPPRISMPLTWDEVSAIAAGEPAEAAIFSPAQAVERVSTLGDIFAPVQSLRQSLPDPLALTPADETFSLR